MVDMAHIAEPERHSSKGEGQGKPRGWDAPAKNKSGVKELLAWDDFPADLQMKRQRSVEDCAMLDLLDE